MTPPVVGSCLAGILKLLFRRSLPKADGVFATEELEQPEAASVARDAAGVPHIAAATDGDLFFLNGVVHGQDRLWQMHAARQLASGRLCEFAGPKALVIDRLARQLGFRRLAEGDLQELRERKEPEAATALLAVESYARGVNWAVQSGTRGRQLPVEFKLTGAKWEPWEAVDCLLLIRLYGFVMGFGFQHVLLRQGLIEMLGPEKAAAWTNTTEEEDSIPHTVDEATWRAFNGVSLSGILSAAAAWLPQGQGSNWWTVHGSLTTTGKPLLAGDPHLSIKVPGFWYELHLRQPAAPPGQEVAITAYGVAPPGCPGVLIGQNGFCATSITLGYCDVEDIFLERIRASDGKYLHRDEWKECEVVEETIKVKGQSSAVVSYRCTCHGVVLDNFVAFEPFKKAVVESQGVGHEGEEVHLVYAGIPLRPKGTAVMAVTATMRARSFKEFDVALSYASTTYSLNFAYADTDGHIGYVLTGEVPVRGGKRGDELLPLPGWTGENDWAGFVPHAQLPKAHDPPSGMVISANHKIVDTSYYSHYLGKIWKSGYRAQAIKIELERRLREKGKLSPDDMAQAQLDVKSWAAVEFVEEVKDVAPDADTADALSMLVGWDGQLTKDSVAASLYQFAHAELAQLLLEKGFEALGAPPGGQAFESLDRPALIGMVCGDPFDPTAMVKMINELQGHLHLNVLRLLRSCRAGADGPANQGRRWWLEQAGGRDAAVNAALRAACAKLRALAGTGWASSPRAAWGKVHMAHFQHPVTRNLGLPPGSPPFDPPSCECDGDTNTTSQAMTKSPTDFTATASNVSLRVLFNLADLEDEKANRIISPLGQSGQFNSRHYCDQNVLWRNGEMRGVVTRPGAVRAVGTMRFTSSRASARLAAVHPSVKA